VSSKESLLKLNTSRSLHTAFVAVAHQVEELRLDALFTLKVIVVVVVVVVVVIVNNKR
jgi:hypothetical protein